MGIGTFSHKKSDPPHKKNEKKKFMVFSHTDYLIMIRKVSGLIFFLRFMTISHTDLPNISHLFLLNFGSFSHMTKK